ncbi:(S)-coclaurine N-methyltransferase-like [Selaginella moellendorffii]|uniref:(S)-coclaurine N-methyltransferase-like n=1 Tax=Selaginella moellendorffii TaxID=88036 RepID=UPI000D1C3346|nr:(S)-coclaurine N-methyltransferase-like [Selaginella moellendorffii]|eukprot:XP_024529053.1 (S)-coclaurine N-methyltransferase-like [Selaginella moellendorffii]
MNPDSLLFSEALTHKSFARHYQETQGDGMTAWIGKYFLNGGTLLADSLLLNFQDDLSIVDHWRIDGRHHGLSSDAYARQMSENADLIRPIFNDIYGKEQANVWMGRWKAVFILFAEMYKFDNGSSGSFLIISSRKIKGSYRISFEFNSLKYKLSPKIYVLVELSAVLTNRVITSMIKHVIIC